MIKTHPKHQPKRQGMLRKLEDLCSQATTKIEGQLKAQEEGDAAARRQREDEEHARQAAEREEQERLKRVRELKAERSMIEAAERELVAKKKALQDKEKALKVAQKVVDPSDDDNDDNDEIDEDNENDGSEHAPEQQAVRYHLFILLFFAHSTTIC